MREEDQKDNLSINNNDIFNNNNFDIDNIPWIISKYVFENNQEHGYRLHRGDIFKLGKYILRVRELGIDDDKKHYFFENKNTQKYIKNRSNNASQIPLNHSGENYFSALNLNQIINVQRKDDNNNNANNENNNENRSNNDNIQIINNDSEHNNSNGNSNSNSLNNNENNAKDNRKNNYGSVLHLNIKKNDSKNENDNNSHKVISIYYSNNPSSRKPNNNSNEIISHGSKKDNDNNDNGNNFFINIINSNKIENNILDDSKNKINNSMNVNSLGFPTFHNNSILNSSYNNSGKNQSNFNSLKNNDIYNENENSKKNSNVNQNNNNNNSNLIKNSIVALKSTASFKKKKLTEIIQKKILKNTVSIENNNNNKPICRICLSEEYEENNPLIHPCNCDGTMKYIHLQCLRLLIQSKIKKTETESCKVFTFKTLECEICKMVFPEKIRIKNSIFSVIDFEKPDKDYIILDGLIKETPEEKSIFIVHFKDKKEIKIGRASDANIRLSDISVSRAHAVISQYNESFYLHDTNSKFGTLISAGNKFCILYNKPFSVQKGNILFEFMMKKTLCATLRCYRPSVILYKTYNDFLDETFLFKNQTKDEELLMLKKTKTVSEYSSDDNIKTNQIKIKSSKNIEFNESSCFNNSKKKNNYESNQSKEENSQSNNNSNENNKSNDNSNQRCDNINNNQQSFFETFKMDKDKSGVNNVGNSQSIGVNKTQEISNIYQRNEIMKSNSKIGISLDNNGNENSLLVNNVNNDK